MNDCITLWRMSEPKQEIIAILPSRDYPKRLLE